MAATLLHNELPGPAVATGSPPGAKSTPSVPSVERVFVILEVLAKSRTGLTLRELAAICGLPKSSVHCIILTLQRSGYLHRNPRTSRYLFGRKLLMLANSALSGLELREHAEPYMRELARRTRLRVHLGILELNEVVVVAKVDPCPGVRNIASWVGKRLELHCTALGKALICNWSEADVGRLAREHTLSRHNDNTISTLKRLQEELAAVRRAGYSVDDEEDVLGFRCVGAPIYGGGGEIVAAMSVSGATSEITAENLKLIASQVLSETLKFSRSIAAVSSQTSSVSSAG